MPGLSLTGAWVDRVAGAVPFARSLPGFGVLAGRAGASPPPPAPFSLECRCGSAVTGMRSERERHESCLNCGERHFVLPADVYPAAPAARPAGAKPKSTESASEAKAAQPVAAPAAPAVPAAPRIPLRTRLKGFVRREATPLRLIALGVAAAVLGTTWWGVVQARRADARVTIAETPAVAEEALAAGQFGVALRGDPHRGDADLASRTPAEIAREAAVRSPADREDWLTAYDRLYRGRWVILDTHAARVAMEEAPAAASDNASDPERSDDVRPMAPSDRIELLYPLVAAGTRFRLIGDPNVPGDLASGDDPQRVVLAGRYGDCVLVPSARGGEVWELRLEPGSAFLWTGADTLSAIGFDLSDPDGAALRAVLDRQATELGLERPPSESPIPEAEEER
ncbi:hypothetical protein [Alienimonas chondri]|uniref:Uncharacterized protein n=1 Tax=Alienimonas chondri TaxID=2681879 RepID=A0ABX1VIM9_9PLAN|nr:hypothetical protein [Alienimonas chondri]NNJ27987.1 hypothetical protein [Alienimonas chondri]